MDALLYLFAIIVLIALFIFATLVWNVMGIRLKRGKCEEIGSEELPEYLRMLFGDYQNRLSNIGFQHSHCQRYDLPTVNEYSIKYAEVMVQKEQKTYALIMPSDLPEPGGVCNIEFMTQLTNGTRLMTMNNIQHRLVGTFPDSLIFDPYAETPEVQWMAHLKNLESSSPVERAELLSPEDLVADNNTFMSKRPPTLSVALKTGRRLLTMSSAVVLP
ncbi:MAG: hypothetical protein AB9903_31460 [Vulcanimicrobiota bacterium]